jgi:hypothetical protein
MAPVASTSVASNTRHAASRLASSPAAKPSKKRKSANKKKPPPKKKKPNASSGAPEVTHPVVTASAVELPDILNPDDNDQLFDFFVSFGVVAQRKMIYSIVDVEGSIHEISMKHSSGMVRLMAAQVIHFQ